MSSSYCYNNLVWVLESLLQYFVLWPTGILDLLLCVFGDWKCTMNYDYSDEVTSIEEENFEVIHCYCEELCPVRDGPGICEVSTPGGKCFASVVTEIDEYGYEYPVRSYGCLPEGQMALLQCKGSLVPHLQSKSILCCDDGDFCNQHLYPAYTIGVYANLVHSVPFILLMSSLCACLVILAAVVSIFVFRFRQKKRNRSDINGNTQLEDPAVNVVANANSGAENEKMDNGNSPGTLAQVIEQSCRSRLPMMVQRTIAKQIEMVKTVGKGRYGEVWLAMWRGETVAVKIFFNSEEQSWLRETEIYQTVLMRHENILGYIAADIKGTGSQTQMLLITDYHEHGSLFDYLQIHSLTVDSLLAFARCIASGLAHIHTEIFGIHGKHSMAHRDITSKHILVKRNGECCISDFGLAVKFNSSSNKIDIPSTKRSSTRRYMAPEILGRTAGELNFESLKMADIYSFGLVLWEICTRCNVEGQPQLEYKVPFEEHVPSEPSFEEMQQIVSVQKIRPGIPTSWENTSAMKVLAKMIQEMWHENPAVRLTSLRVKKTISRLMSPEDVAINIHS